MVQMTQYHIYSKWRRILGGLIFLGFGSLALVQTARLWSNHSDAEPTPSWVGVPVLIVGLLMLVTGLGILFHKGFRPPGAP